MNFKNNKSRVLVGAAVSAVSLSLTGMGATQSSAQSTAQQVLPPVSIASAASTCDEHRAVAWHSAALGPRRAAATERTARVGKRDSHDDGHNPYESELPRHPTQAVSWRRAERLASLETGA